MTFVAISKDGILFTPHESSPLGIFYWRVFRYNHDWYAMAKGGLLYRSKTGGLGDFEVGINLLPGGEERDDNKTDVDRNSPGPRHVAVHLTDTNKLFVYYSNIGDSPERIMRCEYDLKTDSVDWSLWKGFMSPPEEIIRPAKVWEGSNLPITISKSGEAKERENAVRDPGIFVDNDKRVYLLYSVAGESGIGIAEVTG